MLAAQQGSEAKVTTAVERLAGWWLGELRGLLPAALRTAAAPGFELTLDGGRAELLRLGRGGPRRLAAFDLAAPPERVPGLARGATALARLGPGRTLRLRVALPAAAADDLRAALAAEIDRHTPFAAGEACFDYRVEGADPDLERVIVGLAIARRAEAEAALDLGARLGLRILRVGGAGDDGWAFDLTPPERAARRSGGGGRLLPRLALLFVVAGLVAGAAWLDRQERRLDAETARLDGLRAALAEAEQTRAERRRDPAGELLAERARRPTATAILNEATARLDDAHWAERVEIADGAIRIAGRSADAPALIGALEASPRFADARFEGAVVGEPGGGQARFAAAASIVTEAGE